MAISYYDDVITAKLKRWMPDTNKVRVLGPDESTRFFETLADDKSDKPLQLPLITLTRNKDLEILSTIKQLKSFSGNILASPNERNLRVPERSAIFNVIPVQTTYQLNIYTKTKYEGEEYVRNFLFKLINNPQINVNIPYNNIDLTHTAHLRILGTISDTSDIAQHIFPGQFYRWTIQMELQDAFLFNIPYKINYSLDAVNLDLTDEKASEPDDEVIIEIPSNEEL
jgi:hypothetical protein